MPFSAGGSTDAFARLIAVKMATVLHQPVNVENRPGAAGTIGVNAVAKSPPDGYTVCVCTGGTLVLLPLIDHKLPYVPQRDLAPVMLTHSVGFVVVVHVETPYRSLADLVAADRRRPGSLTYGSPGVGGPLHLGIELFKRRSGTHFVHIPYGGEADVRVALLSRALDFGVVTSAAAVTLVQSGQGRAIASLSPARLKMLPDVPTVSESGYPGFSAASFVGFNVPAGTPAPTIDKLHAALDTAVKDAEVARQVLEMGFTPAPAGPGEFSAHMREETAKWAEVLKGLGLIHRD